MSEEVTHIVAEVENHIQTKVCSSPTFSGSNVKYTSTFYYEFADPFLSIYTATKKILRMETITKKIEMHVYFS